MIVVSLFFLSVKEIMNKSRCNFLFQQRTCKLPLAPQKWVEFEKMPNILFVIEIRDCFHIRNDGSRELFITKPHSFSIKLAIA